MILSFILATTMNIYAATYSYTCFENGDAPNQLPKKFTLVQNDKFVILNNYLFHQDMKLGLQGVSQNKAFFSIQNDQLSLIVQSDSSLMSGGTITVDGSYVGTIEVTYDDYREEITQFYFCKRRNL
jgi:hypothetical protein